MISPTQWLSTGGSDDAGAHRSGDIAQKIHNAWSKTIEDGIHTTDLQSEHTKVLVTTDQFAEAVIARLGTEPQRFSAVSYQNSVQQQNAVTVAYQPQAAAEKTLVGVDVFNGEPGFTLGQGQ